MSDNYNQLENDSREGQLQQPVQTSQKTKKPIYKKWWFWPIIVVVLSIIGAAGAKQGGESVANIDTVSEATSDNKTLGDYMCVIEGAEKTKDIMGDDAIVVTYEFTNNSSKATSFDVALKASVFQSGVELQTAFTDDEMDYLVDVKPGTTIQIKRAYSLRDTVTDLEIEVSERISFSDDKIVKIIKFES